MTHLCTCQRSAVGAAASPLPTPYRACELCVHAVPHGPLLLCHGPGTALASGPREVAQARALGGWCGPQARYLDIAGWKASPRAAT